jgi:hypothetical protein
MNPTNESELEKKVDRWLDAALGHYSHTDEAEPRMGLEARVLATLEADRREREQRGPLWLWRVAFAAGLAALLIFAIIRAPWRSKEKPAATPAIATGANGVTKGTQQGPEPPVVATVTSNRAPGAGSRRAQPLHAPAQIAEAPAPRLAQFPAPQPLSEQERLLVALMNNTPPEQLAQDAAVQDRVRHTIEEAQISGGSMLEPRGK